MERKTHTITEKKICHLLRQERWLTRGSQTKREKWVACLCFPPKQCGLIFLKEVREHLACPFLPTGSETQVILTGSCPCQAAVSLPSLPSHSPGPPCPTHPHALCRCRNLWLIRSFMRKNYPIHLGSSKPHCAGGWTQPPSHLWVYRDISANTSAASKQGPGWPASWSCWQTWKPEALSSFQNKQIKKVKEKKKLWATPAQNYTENKQAEWATEYY